MIAFTYFSRRNLARRPTWIADKKISTPRFSVLLVLVFVVALSSCRTIGDVNYVAASDLDEAGRYHEAFNRYQSVVSDSLYPEKEKMAARYRLAQMYMKGIGTNENPSEAIKLYKVVAAGEAKSWRNFAQLELGRIYAMGVSGVIASDQFEAWKWYNAAASDGYEAANPYIEKLNRQPNIFIHQHREEFTLASNAEAPAGMERGYDLFKSGDANGAFRIFNWHARRGNAEAQANVASMYKDGIGVATDSRRYAAWTYEAARNGDPRAQLELGRLYLNGKIVPGSDADAERWLTKAATQGSAEAYNQLGILMLYPVDKGREKNPLKAVYHFKKAAERNSAPALANLGDLYRKGVGVQKDRGRAKTYYIAAARLGLTAARTRLFEHFSYVYNDGDNKQAKKAGKVTIPKRAKASEPVKSVPAKTPSAVELFANLSPSIFRIIAAENKDAVSQGSAVALTESVLVTNCHVISKSAVIATKVGEKIVYFSRSIGDAKKDVCFLSTSNKLRPIPETRSFSDLKVGEKVFAIGSPSGLQNSFSDGRISGLRERDGVAYIQTTAPISSGSSGGALIDEQGRLIGITTFKLRDAENINFAVAIDEALKIMPSGAVAKR